MTPMSSLSPPLKENLYNSPIADLGLWREMFFYRLKKCNVEIAYILEFVLFITLTRVWLL